MAHDNPWHGIGFSQILGVWRKKRNHDACTTHLPWDERYVYLRGWLIHVYCKLVGKYTVDGSEIRRSPVEVGSLPNYKVLYIPGGDRQPLDFWIFHQQ